MGRKNGEKSTKLLTSDDGTPNAAKFILGKNQIK